MPSFEPPKINTQYIFYVGLPSLSSPGSFQASPTLATGDAKVSKDGGALANLATLPTVTPAAGKMVKVTLSATEMNADNVTVVISDAAGAQWSDVIVNIQTSAQQIDDLPVATDIVSAGAITTSSGAIDNVTLVATTTTNTDMRGTNGALTDKAGFSLSATGLDAIVSTATGMVEIAKAIWDRALTGATHNIATSAGRRLRGIQEFQGYEGGQVWIDTVDGTAGTVDFENGTVENSVLTFTDAVTIADSLVLKDFHIINGSSITLASDLSSHSFFGDNWSLALGGQIIAGAYIQGATVSGVGISATEVHLEGCDIATMSVQIGHFDFCSFSGTVTHTLAGDYNYHDCYSKVPGVSFPTFAKTAGQAVTVQYRRWSGGIGFTGLEVGDTMTISGELGTIDLGSPTGAVIVEIRGTYKEIVNVGSAAINIEGAILGGDVADILEDTGTTLPAQITAAFTEIKGATWSAATDTLEAIRNRGDAAWTTATGFATHSAADVWAVATRLLTAGTNIVLAKGTGVTGFNDLSAAQVNAEVDTAISDVFTFTVAGEVDANIQSVNDATVLGDGQPGTEWGS